MPLLVEDQVVQVPALHASGIFTDGNRRGTGDFYFLDNKNNPLMLESTIQFNWENSAAHRGHSKGRGRRFNAIGNGAIFDDAP